jgi:hypothetical protein
MKKTRKPFVICKKNMFLNKQTIWEGKSIQNLKQTKYPSSSKHSNQDPRLYPCDNEHKQKLAKCKERLSITENQSQASFKLMNQSNIDIISSPQETKENMGDKRKIDSLQQIL